LVKDYQGIHASINLLQKDMLNLKGVSSDNTRAPVINPALD
jgi:hypothetical protein